eukprot:TRINITY_DN6028_c0_g1_i1.p1 TRINITY_DN6028_c0_g1~~TRINITY_DN6028_c0_g1_i1.p1  ORF type:complete len:821 (+),score=182.29 TRINITY_DN6028_c0_g1_i1:44-2506(+)
MESKKAKNVRVVVRVKPTQPCEKDKPFLFVERRNPQAVPDTVVLNDYIDKSVSRRYSYDAVYDEKTTQNMIYEKEVFPCYSLLRSGINTTLFCVGMTNSGKTFTMAGDTKNPGIVPRVAQDIFVEMSTKMSDSRVWVSFLEIYNEKVYDLIEPKAFDLPLRETSTNRVVVANLSERLVENSEQMKGLYSLGCKNRKTGSTKLNLNSSRSHSVLIIKVALRNGQKAITSKLQLIDLAGNEDNRLTGNQGKRLTESANIHKSLFTLGNVIAALNSGENRIPYRDSKLTRLLQDSLGGGSFAVMICTVSAHPRFHLFTARTLNFAAQGKNIVNYVEPNEQISSSASFASFSSPALSSQNQSDDEDNANNTNTIGTGGKKDEREKKSGNVLVRQVSSSSSSLSSCKSASTYSAPVLTDLRVLSAQLTGDSQLTERLKELSDSITKATKIIAITSLQQQQQQQVAVPLTPVSTAEMAKVLVCKAKLWEKAGQWTNALAEYSQAAHLLPENEKLQKKLNDLHAKLISASSSFSPSSASAKTALQKKDHVEEKESDSIKRLKYDTENEEKDERSALFVRNTRIMTRRSFDDNDKENAPQNEEELDQDSSAEWEPDENDNENKRSEKKSKRKEFDFKKSTPLGKKSASRNMKSAPSFVPPISSSTSSSISSASLPPSLSSTSVSSSAVVSKKKRKLIGFDEKAIEQAKLDLANVPVSSVQFSSSVPEPSKPVEEKQIKKETQEFVKKQMDETMKGLICQETLDVLNSAGLKNLKQLHQIGDKRAKLIISFRESGGRFTKLNDLSKIGMSEKMISSFYQRNLLSELLGS